MENLENDGIRTPEFECETVYDMNRLMRFNLHHFLRKKWFIASVLVMVGFVALTFIVSWIFEGFNGDLFFALVVVLGLCLLYLVLTLVVPFFTVKKSPNYLANLHMSFFKDGFSVAADTKMGDENSNLRYEAIYRITESKSDLYLYISSNQAMIVDKNGFTLGDAECLKAFLYARVKPSIYKCK